jgi:hypothetical protein
MSNPGWFAAIACAVLILAVNAAIWGVVSVAADGLGRNHVAGVRLPSVMRSDETWVAGHAAARKAMRPFLLVAIIVIVISIPAQLVPVLYVVLIGLSLACTLGALVAAAVSASRAAQRVTSAR